MGSDADLRGRLAHNVRAFAEAKGLPITRLADEAGMSRTQLWNLLALRKAATLRTIAKLADVLEVDPADLLSQPKERKR